MDVLEERKRLTREYNDEVRNHMAPEEKEAVKQILDILEASGTSVAGAIWMLHVCETFVYNCSAVFGHTKSPGE